MGRALNPLGAPADSTALTAPRIATAERLLDHDVPLRIVTVQSRFRVDLSSLASTQTGDGLCGVPGNAPCARTTERMNEVLSRLRRRRILRGWARGRLDYSDAWRQLQRLMCG